MRRCEIGCRRTLLGGQYDLAPSSNVEMKLLRLPVALLLLTLATDTSAQSTCEQPFTLAEVVHLVKNADESAIIRAIQQHKVDFALTRENLELLTNMDATSRVLAAIEDNPYQELYFTFPHTNQVISHHIEVKGCGKHFPGRYLRLFTHQQGVSDWLRQVGAVHIEADGTWSHPVCIGRALDDGPAFEIKAVWVGEKTHEKMEAALRTCKRSNEICPDRCPGTQLPSVPSLVPTAQVRVFRLDGGLPKPGQ